MEKRLKKYLKKVYKEGLYDPMYGPDVAMTTVAYKDGYKAKEQEIRDKLNMYQSQLAEMSVQKMGRKHYDLFLRLELEQNIKIFKALLI